MINVIIPAYNVEKWIGKGIGILRNQTYKDFKCVIIDDGSTDKTVEKINESIRGDDRFHLIQNSRRTGTSLGNYLKGFDYLNPDDQDIVAWNDGDDWLKDENVLEKIDRIYKESECWMTYGSWEVYPTGEKLDWTKREFPERIHEKNTYRDIDHLTTHLRTHRAFLLRKIEREDLIDPVTKDDYCKFANDTCYLYPMLEMCGEAKRIKLVKEVLYVLNRENPLNEHKIDFKRQQLTVSLIKKKERYTKLL